MNQMNAGNDTPTTQTVSNRLLAFYPYLPIQTLDKQEFYTLLIGLLSHYRTTGASAQRGVHRSPGYTSTPGLQFEVFPVVSIAVAAAWPHTSEQSEAPNHLPDQVEMSFAA